MYSNQEGCIQCRDAHVLPWPTTAACPFPVCHSCGCPLRLCATRSLYQECLRWIKLEVTRTGSREPARLREQVLLRSPFDSDTNRPAVIPSQDRHIVLTVGLLCRPRLRFQLRPQREQGNMLRSGDWGILHWWQHHR